MTENWNGEERRHNRLHEDDLRTIIDGISSAIGDHYCRFAKIKTSELEDVIPFMMSFKGLTEKTGVLVWKIIVGAVMATVLGLISLGVWKKVQ